MNPEQVTELGLDFGVYADLKSKLSDISPAGDTAWLAQLKRMRDRLKTVNRTNLTAVDRIRYDTLDYALDRGVDGGAFFYGGGSRTGFKGGAQPYVISQMDGAIVDVPDFLGSMHRIQTAADADAYLARVSAMARQLDDETARIRNDGARGVSPPDFIAAATLAQLKAFRATPSMDQSMVKALSANLVKAGIRGRWVERCARLIDAEVYPALDRQIDGFAAATAAAPHTAGVDRLPLGDNFYRYALRQGTTTTYTPAEVHAIGLEQNKALEARMDVLLKKQGLTQGSVSERVEALNHDKRFLFPDNNDGRDALLGYLKECIVRNRALLPRLSHLNLKVDVAVRRVPVDIQDGATLGYMTFGSLDGSRPATYYVNLKSTSLWPKHQLPDLTAHETIPGHAWKGAYLAAHRKDTPTISSFFDFNAFEEGWALYAEQLVDELGLYDNDPFGKIGYLQSVRWRACRLVADTGLHAMHWTRDQSIAFMSDQTGKGRAAMTNETDRYCVRPGQACGYKVGQNEILRLRERAKDALGDRFDLQEFDDAIVKTGGVPLPVLETAIDDFLLASRRPDGR